MSDINTVKAQIRSLIDLANTTTGNQDTNLTDGVNALVSGFGQGSSLVNGHDINFYDESNNMLQTMSVRDGVSIAEPVYPAKKWVATDGEVISFPYLPIGSIDIYANSDTLAKALYDFYGVDIVEYPYLMLIYSTYSYHMYSKIWFGKTVTKPGNSAIKFDSEVLYGTTANKAGNWNEDMTTYVSNVQTAIPTVTNNTQFQQWTFSAPYHYVYTNFDILALGYTEENVSTIGIYRLDE